MAKAKSTPKATPTAPQKPAPKPRKRTSDKPLSARYKRLLKDELDAWGVDIGITAASDLRQIRHALDALMNTLLRGDEADVAVGHLMRFPVKRLGVIVDDNFRHLDRDIQKLRDIIAEEKKEEAKRKGGAR